MIETESIEEFTPTKSWETPIRHLARFASLLLIGILFIRFFISNDLEQHLIAILSFSSNVLFFLIFAIYLGGLGLVFLQIRIVNTTRKKTTNLISTLLKFIMELCRK